MSEERIAEVFLLGQRLSLRTDLPEETVQEILSLLADKEKEISQKKPFLPPMKVALLMLLQIAADYVKIKQEMEVFRQVVREKVERLEDFLEKENSSLGCA